MEVNELTQKDFKIGQSGLCSICVRSDNKKVSMFFNIAYFSDVKMIRKLKLEKINKSV
jgi:hypothetical protein